MHSDYSDNEIEFKAMTTRRLRSLLRTTEEMQEVFRDMLANGLKTYDDPVAGPIDVEDSEQIGEELMVLMKMELLKRGEPMKGLSEEPTIDERMEDIEEDLKEMQRDAPTLRFLQNASLSELEESLQLQERMLAHIETVGDTGGVMAWQWRVRRFKEEIENRKH